MKYRRLGWFTSFRYMPFQILVFSLSIVLGVTCDVSDTIVLTQNTTHTSSGASNAARGNNYQIFIEAASYIPMTINIEPGGTITWINKDMDTHTITSIRHFQDEDDLSHVFIGETWDSGDIGPGQSFSITFGQSGTFEYLSLPLHTSLPFLQYYDFSAHNVIGVVIVA